MLEAMAMLLLIVWPIGMVTGQTFGGIIHVIIALAMFVFVLRLITGRREV